MSKVLEHLTGSTRYQGNVVYNLAPQQLDTVLNPDSTQPNLTPEQRNNPNTEAVLGLVRLSNDNPVVTNADVTISLNNNQLTVAPVSGSTRYQGSVIYNLAPQQLDTVLNPDSTQPNLTPEQRNNPNTEAVLGLVRLSNDNPVVTNADVTISLNNNQLTVAPVSGSTRYQGSVVYNVAPQLPNVLKPAATTQIELAENERTNLQSQSVLDKIKKATDSQVQLEDVKITLIDNNKKLQVKALATSSYQGEVIYNLQQAQASELSNVLEPSTVPRKVTLPSLENLDTEANKKAVLEQIAKDQTLTLNDVTITFDNDKKTVTVATKEETKNFKGQVVYGIQQAPPSSILTPPTKTYFWSWTLLIVLVVALISGSGYYYAQGKKNPNPKSTKR
ncbi:Hypothetical Protein SLY_1072 [Strawberry lethal yellows phytoplasma (CPA) str. NZSb11]|uniref:Uncharacterized protein n=1 Tax=Strawberry lethal yellows phytoplasma (CPA) str. NZSb11 TaxID=980422 RepID=R4S2G5_PHYAS|nr:Hypothetical Protein SLY_1072 [Strawberry lethal yellows phytoplasma (CPA) str. NZSb11]